MPELTRRYVVSRLATEAPFDLHDPDAPFVLKPWKDPAALAALRAYRERCYPELGRDLEAWIRAIERGPAVRGDVGRRNETHAGVPRAASRTAGAAAGRAATDGAARGAAAKRAEAKTRRRAGRRTKRR